MESGGEVVVVQGGIAGIVWVVQFVLVALSQLPLIVRCISRSTQNSTTSSSTSPRKERVVGAQRVWGTLSICTSGVIQRTIR